MSRITKTLPSEGLYSRDVALHCHYAIRNSIEKNIVKAQSKSPILTLMRELKGAEQESDFDSDERIETPTVKRFLPPNWRPLAPSQFSVPSKNETSS